MENGTINVKVSATVHPLFYVGMAIARFGVWMFTKFNIVVSTEIL